MESHPSNPVDAPLTSSKRVLLVEDEDFTRVAVASFLQSQGYEVHAVATAAEALDVLDSHDPHALVTDLDLGPGPSGVDLAQRIDHERPWVGIVILTAHQSVHLAVRGPDVLPAETVMVVKSSLDSMQDISDAIEQSILQVKQLAPVDIGGRSHVVVSTVQAEILRMMAEGLSNAGIAERRGTTLRAAEASVQRTLQALGINADPHLNSRVLAVRMWQAGQVTVR